MSRHSHWLRCLGFALLASSAQAQAPGRSPKEIGEIINTALQAVIPAGDLPPNHPMTNTPRREIRFDYDRTMANFVLEMNADVRANLGLAYAEGSRALLDGCDQMGAGSCERLGRSVYAWVDPISISRSEAKVFVHTLLASTPSTRTFLSVWITEVILTRSGTGPWKFLKFGRGLIS